MGLGFVGDCSCLCVSLYLIGCLSFRVTFLVLYCSFSSLLKMYKNYHAAFWSSSPSTQENRYRITHHNTTKRRGETQQQQERQQCLDYTTWEEIDRWAVDPGRVPEPAWDSLEQCEEGYRRMERQARRRGRKPESQPQKCIGGGTQEVWRSQVGDLRQLPVLTGEREGPGRHRVMLWSARCLQCGCIA